MTFHEKFQAIANLFKQHVNTEEQWNEKAKRIREILDTPAPSAPKVKTEDAPDRPPETQTRQEKGGRVRSE